VPTSVTPPLRPEAEGWRTGAEPTLRSGARIDSRWRRHSVKPPAPRQRNRWPPPRRAPRHTDRELPRPSPLRGRRHTDFPPPGRLQRRPRAPRGSARPARSLPFRGMPPAGRQPPRARGRVRMRGPAREARREASNTDRPGPVSLPAVRKRPLRVQRGPPPAAASSRTSPRRRVPRRPARESHRRRQDCRRRGWTWWGRGSPSTTASPGHRRHPCPAWARRRTSTRPCRHRTTTTWGRKTPRCRCGIPTTCRRSGGRRRQGANPDRRPTTIGPAPKRPDAGPRPCAGQPASHEEARRSFRGTDWPA